MRIYLERICRQGAIFIIALFLLSSFFQGCTNSDSSDIFISSPTLEMNPNGNTPLAGRIVFSTIDEYKTQMTMSDGETQETVQFSQFQTEHEYMILGCKSGREYTLDLTLEDHDGSLRNYKQVVTFQTDELPSDFPSMAITSVPERMLPGITLNTHPICQILSEKTRYGSIINMRRKFYLTVTFFSLTMATIGHRRQKHHWTRTNFSAVQLNTPSMKRI